MPLASATAPRPIFPDLAGDDVAAVLAALCRQVAAAGLVPDAGELCRRLAERERLGSTALGGGFAVPHCKLPGLRRPLVAAGVAARPVDWGAADGLPVRVLFLVVSPPEAPAAHLRALAAISRWLRSDGHAASLPAAGSTEEIEERLAASGGWA
jgi:PTS system nitrogen regulatory IIA component